MAMEPDDTYDGRVNFLLSFSDILDELGDYEVEMDGGDMADLDALLDDENDTAADDVQSADEEELLDYDEDNTVEEVVEEPTKAAIAPSTVSKTKLRQPQPPKPPTQPRASPKISGRPRLPIDTSVPPPSAVSLASMASTTSSNEWDKAIDQFLHKTMAPRPSSPRRRRSRSPTHRKRKHVTSSAVREEAGWRKTARGLGLDADDYIDRLRQQQRLREMKMMEKRRRRAVADGELDDVVRKEDDVQLADMRLHPKLRTAPPKRMACVPRTASGKALNTLVNAHHQLMQDTANSSTSSTAASLTPPTDRITIQGPKVHMSPLSRLKPPPSLVVQPIVTKVADLSSRRVVLPSRRLVTMDAEEPAKSALSSRLADRLSARKANPKNGVAPPTATQKTTPVIAKARLPPPSVPKPVRQVTRIPSPQPPSPTIVKPPPSIVKPPPSPLTPKIVAHIAAVIDNVSDKISIGKLKIIAGTVGTVTMCERTTPSSVSIVFVDAGHASSFVQQYDGKRIGGAVLALTLGTFYQPTK